MFSTLNIVFLFSFIGVTSLLMLMTIANRLRVRRVVLSWQAGSLLGWPLWPTLFIAAVLSMMIYALVTDQQISPVVFIGFLMGGAFWFVSVWLASAVMVTEYGILRSVSRAREAVAWGQMVDYFEVASRNGCRYVFIFIDDRSTHSRLELHVPAAFQHAFQQVVHAKLDIRMEYAAEQAYGKKTLEG